ncbi:MAG TPA: DUF1801 domain-containing protein [Anaerolineales bacterium]|nr:DUF1801 domain-containing protein [Anaerolineales bacterium]
MRARDARFTTIDEYIALFPRSRQRLLKQMRSTIKAAAPGASEKISYGMPAFALRTTLVWFSGLKDHIGFYPTGGGIHAFRRELAGYETTPGSVKFPVEEPLPLELITKIVRYRVAQDERGAKRTTSGQKKTRPRKPATRGKST